MKQVVVIHGGDSFNTEQEFVAALKAWPVTIDRYLPQQSWKRSLQDELGNGYQVLQPNMPNKENAHYEHWKIWFELMFQFLQDEVILVGHSQGGLFLTKYLSENNFPNGVAGLFLVAAPHNETPEVGDFALTKNLDGVLKQSSNIHLYYSKDDPVVPFAAFDFYSKALPQAKVHVFEDRQHFNQESFPELVVDIKSI